MHIYIYIHRNNVPIRPVLSMPHGPTFRRALRQRPGFGRTEAPHRSGGGSGPEAHHDRGESMGIMVYFGGEPLWQIEGNLGLFGSSS